MFIAVTVLSAVVILLAPIGILIAIWGYHLQEATKLCDQVSKLGTGSAGLFSIDSLGECEHCLFKTDDGITLRGTYLRHQGTRERGTIIFCHEFGGDRHGAVPYMKELVADGYNLFTFDFRNHGESERSQEYTPRNWATKLEVLDVLAAIRYVCSFKRHDERVALMGLSRGASAAFCAASHSSRVWGIVTDGAFESRWVTAAHIRRFMPQFVRLAPLLVPLPWFIHKIYGRVVHDIVARNAGYQCAEVARAVRALQVPSLLIHGKRDSTIQPEIAIGLWRSIRATSRLWLVPKSGHNRSLRTQPARYMKRVRRFLNRFAPPIEAPQHPRAPIAESIW